MDKVDASYFAEANRWDADRERLLSDSAKRAWKVSIAASVLAALACSSLLLLIPLKRTEPYLIRVDTTTGAAEVVPSYVGTMELPETVLRHFVTEYVTLRERYVPALAESDYEQIGAYQSAGMNQAWASAWVKTNPDSPLNRYSDDARVTVQVRSVSFLRRERSGLAVVQVRILRSTQAIAGAEEKVEHFVATMTAQFLAPSTDTHLRALNPLGFRVFEYRREPEDMDSSPAPRSPVVGGGVS